jgi:hypothetical protein
MFRRCAMGLSVCFVFGSVLVARAELISLRQVRTPGDTYDEVDLYITAITGADAPAGHYLTLLKGTFSLPAGDSFYLDSSSKWYTKDVNDFDYQDTAGPPSGSSWINCSTQFSIDPHTRAGGSGNLWNSFTQTIAVTSANNGAFFLGPVDLTPDPGPGGPNDPSNGDGSGFDTPCLRRYGFLMPHPISPARRSMTVLALMPCRGAATPLSPWRPWCRFPSPPPSPCSASVPSACWHTLGDDEGRFGK